MKRKLMKAYLISLTLLTLVLLVACGPAVLPQTATPTPFLSPIASPTAVLTDTPCIGLCPNDSMTATAAMATTFAAIPSNTPPAGVTVVPIAGDLGFGSVYGQIVDGNTGRPIEGATVKCEHFSYTSPYPCKGTTTTNGDGIYAFLEVYFHDTDKITLTVDAPGYAQGRVEQTGFALAEFQANLGLFPETNGASPTPFLMCTAPACSNGVLACGDPNGCLGGCGTICTTATATP